jgi:ATP-dependent RNA helicase RhlE
LGLIEPLLRAVAESGYAELTPIQARAVPLLLEGRDVIGCAQTGTGKTAAFALPILQRLTEHPHRAGRRRIRALVLSPTRELAAQIGESFIRYGKHLPHRSLTIFGGVGQGPQVEALRRGVDILVATPGRLLDLHGQGLLDLGDVEHFVLDEADRMLDMGFIHDIRRVLKLLPPAPRQPQSLLFSATVPPPIVKLAEAFLRNPAKIEVTPEVVTVELVDQQVMFVERSDKRDLLVHILRRAEVERALVFTRTKHGANRLARQLEQAGIVAEAIHGNKSQNARTRALSRFKDGEARVLVATDVAARGLDVFGISHVINFDLPNEPESYVHRVGRTGRAGHRGVAISFCDSEEGDYLRDIERLTGETIPRLLDHPYHSPAAVVASPGAAGSRDRPSAWQARGTRGGGPPRGEAANRQERPRNDRASGRTQPERPSGRNRSSYQSRTEPAPRKPSPPPASSEPARQGSEGAPRRRRRRRRTSPRPSSGE